MEFFSTYKYYDHSASSYICMIQPVFNNTKKNKMFWIFKKTKVKNSRETKEETTNNLNISKDAIILNVCVYFLFIKNTKQRNSELNTQCNTLKHVQHTCSYIRSTHLSVLLLLVLFIIFVLQIKSKKRRNVQWRSSTNYWNLEIGFYYKKNQEFWGLEKL